MPEFAEGGIIPAGTKLLFEPETGCPASYSTPGYSPPIPGADWFIEGRRFREVHRVGNSTHLRLVEET